MGTRRRLKESVEEISPTQNEVQEEGFCKKTQQAIQSAELLCEGSLLQDSIWPESIKLPIPTTTEQEVILLFGRQEKGVPDHSVFVKLHNHSRASKQPTSEHHSPLRLTLVGGLISPSLQDLHAYQARFTIFTDSTGCQCKLTTATTATRVPMAAAVFFTSAHSCHGCHRRIVIKNMRPLNFLFNVDSSRNRRIRRLEPSQRSWSREGRRTRTRHN